MALTNQLQLLTNQKTGRQMSEYRYSRGIANLWLEVFSTNLHANSALGCM